MPIIRTMAFLFSILLSPIALAGYAETNNPFLGTWESDGFATRYKIESSNKVIVFVWADFNFRELTYGDYKSPPCELLSSVSNELIFRVKDPGLQGDFRYIATLAGEDCIKVTFTYSGTVYNCKRVKKQ